MKNIIEAKGIEKTFINGEIKTLVLKGIDFSVREGEFVAIMGRSGAGKSTLMYQLSLLDEPSSGEVYIEEKNVLKLDRREKTKFRLKHLGFVFQDYALVPELTAVENVALPLIMDGLDIKKAYQKAREVLKDFELVKKSDNLPSQLSGGEQQRVSIARAIVADPKIIFADEPTANLDGESAKIVIDILKKLNRRGQTIVMVTHEKEYGLETDRIVHLADGKIDREEHLR